MKKSTKGAVAAAAAGVMLLGGAGSLAYWTAEGSVAGSSITAGQLKLSAATCDTDWTYATGSASAGDAVDLFVPGDKITKECTFDVTATGDNLKATLTAPDEVDLTTDDEDVTLAGDVDASYAIGATALADGDTITSDNNGDTITVTFTVDINHGTADDPDADPAVVGTNGNATQSVVASLDDLTVTLTQVNPNA